MTKKLWLSAVGVLIFAAGVPAQNTEAKFEAGAQFSMPNRPAANRGTLFGERYPKAFGFGGRFGYALSRFCLIEGEANFFPAQPDDTGRIGGAKTQGLFGVKAGRRFESLGLFAKVRPGFVHFERVIDCPDGTIRSCNDNGKNTVALDIGGVVEYYPSRRTAVRFDLGDTVIWTGSVQIFPFFPELPGAVRIRTGTTNNFQFSAGFSFRF